MHFNEQLLRLGAAQYVEAVLRGAKADVARVPILTPSGEADPRRNSVIARIEVLERQLRLLERESDPLEISMVATTVTNAAQLALDLAVDANEAMESLQRNHASVSASINRLWPTREDIRNLQQASESANVVAWKESWERSRKSVAIALAVLIVLAVVPLPIRITIAGCALTLVLTLKGLIEANIDFAESRIVQRVSLLQGVFELLLRRATLALGGIVAGTRIDPQDRPQRQA